MATGEAVDTKGSRSTTTVIVGLTNATEVAELAPGAVVEVRRRFDRAWARGFEVVSVGDAGVLLRRTSDGVILPVEFPCDDVRPASPASPRRPLRRSA